MWQMKFFKSKESMAAFIAKNENRIQYVEIFINNRYGIEYRNLRKIG